MIDRERGLWSEQFGNVTIIRGSATPRVAGGVGGGEVDNELRDLGIHPNASRTRPHYCSAKAWALWISSSMRLANESPLFFRGHFR